MIKPYVNKGVMWSIKNHWLILAVMVGLQYVTGKIISGDWKSGANLNMLLRIHELNGLMIFTAAGLLTAEKLWLWLLRKGKI